jgi:hypothetical protein
MKLLSTIIMAGLCLAAQPTFSQSASALSFKFPGDTAARTFERVSSGSTAVNSKAVISFHNSYPSATEERWSATPDGTRVRFMSENMQIIENYNRRGRWTGTIRYLPLNKLPKDVVYAVTQTYPGYSIFFAQDVRTAYGYVHIVKIETGTNWKTLKISGSDVETIEDMDKI